jgi:heme a synthase
MTGFRACSQHTGPSRASGRELKPVARLAWLIVAYNIAVILWGAYVRTSGSGAGCGSRWPLCNGEILPSITQSQTLIEFMHRVTSAVCLILVFFLVVWCWRHTSKGDWPRYSSVGGLFFCSTRRSLALRSCCSITLGWIHRQHTLSFCACILAILSFSLPH